jgi:hypothetical protein
MPKDEDEAILEIAGEFYNQEQAATIAFNSYTMSGRVLEAGLLTWHTVTGDKEFSLRDYAFLVLYFLDKLATDEIKEICVKDLRRIKEVLS